MQKRLLTAATSVDIVDMKIFCGSLLCLGVVPTLVYLKINLFVIFIVTSFRIAGK